METHSCIIFSPKTQVLNLESSRQLIKLHGLIFLTHPQPTLTIPAPVFTSKHHRSHWSWNRCTETKAFQSIIFCSLVKMDPS